MYYAERPKQRDHNRQAGAGDARIVRGSAAGRTPSPLVRGELRGLVSGRMLASVMNVEGRGGGSGRCGIPILRRAILYYGGVSGSGVLSSLRRSYATQDEQLAGWVVVAAACAALYGELPPPATATECVNVEDSFRTSWLLTARC